MTIARLVATVAVTIRNTHLERHLRPPQAALAVSSSLRSSAAAENEGSADRNGE